MVVREDMYENYELVEIFVVVSILHFPYCYLYLRFYMDVKYDRVLDSGDNWASCYNCGLL